MKAPLALFLASALFAVPAVANSQSPQIASAWAQLRKEPRFDAPKVPLSALWGVSLPLGNVFRVEKLYGRWIYGTPAPLAKMKAKDYAKAGWVYSRMLLPPNDSPTQERAELELIQRTNFYASLAWKKLGLDPEVGANRHLSFLEALVLSRRTMQAFRQSDESLQGSWNFSLFPAALAEEKSLGLVGPKIDFLTQEFQVLEGERKKEEQRRELLILKAPSMKPLDNPAKDRILARFLVQRYMELPSLSHEEIDGSLYMRAITLRALEACPTEVQKYWKNKSWSILRFLQLRGEGGKSWKQIALPGYTFAVSAKAIDSATNEAELAYLLLRPMVSLAQRNYQAKKQLSGQWPMNLSENAGSAWQNSRHVLSSKHTEGVDVADEIAADKTSLECLAKAGYAPQAALNYLRRMILAKEEKDFHEQSIGLEYRLEKFEEFLLQAREKNLFPLNGAVNSKRYTQALRFWNVL